MKLYYLSRDGDNYRFIRDMIKIGKNNPHIFNNYSRYMKHINSNPAMKREYSRLSSFINEMYNHSGLDSYQISGQVGGQVGGQMEAVAIVGIGSSVSMSMMLLAVGSFLIYNYLSEEEKPRRKCHPDYPLISKDEIIETSNIMSKLSPMLSKPETLDEIKKLSSELDGYMQYLLNATELGLSAGAIVATEGMGGDIVVKLLFSVFDVIGFLNFLIETTEKMEDPDLMRIFADILNIDFRDGPFGVKCWVNYIIEDYGRDNPIIQKICNFYDNIEEKFTEYVGKIVGGLIPDVPRLVTAEISKEIVKYEKHKIFHFLDQKYHKIDKKVRKLVQDPSKLDKVLDKILETMKDYIVNLPEKLPIIVKEVIKKNAEVGALATPIPFAGIGSRIIGEIAGETAAESLALVSKITGLKNLEQLGVPVEGIDKFFETLIQHSALISDGIHKSLAIMFSLVYILKYCSSQ